MDMFPGPDDLTCEFYKAVWDIVGEDFVIAVKSFFQNWFLSKRDQFYNNGLDSKEWNIQYYEGFQAYIMMQCYI